MTKNLKIYSYSGDHLKSLNRAILTTKARLGFRRCTLTGKMLVEHKGELSKGKVDSYDEKYKESKVEDWVLKSSTGSGIIYRAEDSIIFMLEEPFESLPLYLNSCSHRARNIAKWRLEHGV